MAADRKGNSFAVNHLRIPVPVVCPGYIVVIYGNEIIPFLYIHIRPGQRPCYVQVVLRGAEDGGKAIAVCFSVRYQVCTQESWTDFRPIFRLTNPVLVPAEDIGMAHGNFPHHLGHQPVEAVPAGDIGNGRAVLFPQLLPIMAMEIFVVEKIPPPPPGIIENLLVFRQGLNRVYHF